MKLSPLIFISFSLTALAQVDDMRPRYELNNSAYVENSTEEVMQRLEPGTHQFHIHHIGDLPQQICYGPPYHHTFPSCMGQTWAECIYSDPVPCPPPARP
jgi:hypothetical protein